MEHKWLSSADCYGVKFVKATAVCIRTPVVVKFAVSCRWGTTL